MARLDEKGMELVKAMSSECETPADVTKLLKELFAGTLEQMLEAEMDTHLGYDSTALKVTTVGIAVMDTVKRPSNPNGEKPK